MATLDTGLAWYYDLKTAGATINAEFGGPTLTKRGTVNVSSAGAPDGSSDCIDCGAQAGKFQATTIARPFNFAAGYTVSIWVYRTTGTPALSSICFNMRDSNVGTGGDDYFLLGVNRLSNTTDQGITYDTANTQRTAAHTAEALNTWQMLTLTDDGTTATLYRNGSSVATDSTSLGATDTGAAGVGIGGIGWTGTAGGTNDHFGRLAMAGLWSIVLPASGVAALYNSGAGLYYASLAGASYGAGPSLLLFNQPMHGGGMSRLYGGIP